jgi:hypothetical protein
MAIREENKITITFDFPALEDSHRSGKMGQILEYFMEFCGEQELRPPGRWIRSKFSRAGMAHYLLKEFIRMLASDRDEKSRNQSEEEGAA